MATHDKKRQSLWFCVYGALLGVIVLSSVTSIALAQGGFQMPWDEPEVRPEPRRQPRGGGDGWQVAPQQQGAGDGWTARSDVCLRLEQQLVKETRQGSQTRNLLPKINAEIRKYERIWRKTDIELERRGCIENFLFSRSIRRTRRCVALSNEAEDARRRIAQLRADKQQLQTSAGRSYQDDIIRELARNNCGQQYQQEARRRDRGIFADLWGDEDSSTGSGYANGYNNLPFATYRTLCVRLCDGYYFPVSFSTLPGHFQRDEDLCQSKCAAPAKLFYYQNPGGAIDQMLDAQTNEPYTQLKEAFLYRKEYVSGCSCKQAEYKPPQTPFPEDGANPPVPPAQQEGTAKPNDQRAQAATDQDYDPRRR
ncbi:MAG: DUF2865 domain-containing protein [Hyphomicrobiaceae bacterium]